jgi:hypothetical protein
VVFAALVLGRARRLDIALTFLLSYAGLLFARAYYLGILSRSRCTSSNPARC